MAGLVSDPARQAHDTFRGYIYQILRSIQVCWSLVTMSNCFSKAPKTSTGSTLRAP
ncbi:hypothetical protein [Ochrobactrum sp. RH2CCR150]|uniref:hypothetical protein n=1 Tax=Ochrobactrum sp. RH2CCR150 TaxID=2587044 RepID=UPI0015F98516|nr:hypothetical protein [Ochrobactrum sp. RH2CCR150]